MSRALWPAAPRRASCRSGRPGCARSRAVLEPRLARDLSRRRPPMEVRVPNSWTLFNRRVAMPVAVLLRALRRHGRRGAVARRLVVPADCNRALALSFQRRAEALAANRAHIRSSRATMCAVRRIASSRRGLCGARARFHVVGARRRAHARFNQSRAAERVRPRKSLRVACATHSAAHKTV